MAKPKDTFLLLDTNMIGAYMRDEDFFKRLYDHTLRINGGERVILLPTGTGLLEFIGTKIEGPPASIVPNPDLITELRELAKTTGSNYAGVVQPMKADLYRQHLQWIKQQAKFSHETLAKTYGEKFAGLPREASAGSMTNPRPKEAP